MSFFGAVIVPLATPQHSMRFLRKESLCMHSYVFIGSAEITKFTYIELSVGYSWNRGPIIIRNYQYYF